MELSPQVILPSIIIVFLSGWLLHRHNSKKELQNNAQKSYTRAKYLFDNGEYKDALLSATQASTYWPSHSIYNLMGHIYEKLDANWMEMESFHHAWKERNRRSTTVIEQRHDQDTTYYLYREAYAFSKMENWKFVLIRSTHALNRIAFNTLPNKVDGDDFEQELRALRLVAAIHQYRGMEAFTSSSDDAMWLSKNANRKLLKKLGSSMRRAIDLVETPPEDLDLSKLDFDWEEYLKRD